MVGGTTAVPAAVATELAAIAPVERVSGSNRYSVSASLSERLWPGGASTAYVAVGTRFPDALAGGPLTRFGGGPLLLVERRNMARTVAEELVRLAPDRIVVLGGPLAVSETIWWVLGGYYG